MSAFRRIYDPLRNNWRITILVVLVIIATYFLFVPGATIGDDGTLADEGERGLTNLQYGIDLAGGARISAPVYGYTAEEVQLESTEDVNDARMAISNYLDIDEGDVNPNAETNTIEVFDPAVDRDSFESALIEAGFDPDTFSIREGVTAETRSRIVDVLSGRIDAAGFAGGSVRSETTAGGESFIVVESPGRGLDELRQVIGDRGVVQVIAHYPTEDGWEEDVVLRDEHMASIGTVRFNDERQSYETPITVSSGYAPDFVDLMQQGGFDQPEGWSACNYPSGPGAERPQERPNDSWGYCLLIVQDGQILDGYGVRGTLGEQFAEPSRTFELDPTFVISVQEFSEAERVRINLEEGALAASINIDDASTLMVSPALAERFLQNSLLTGLLAILAVITMVFLRYGDPRVAAPMSVTALSELYILLGFAAAIGMSLDLAHMAGFIAVVGTGVDDLIIIADEVMGDTDVRSQRVFDSRFRKAFWVIGAAAATTIIAMSPLAIMTLGDLRGFAIVTILGVLIGVFLTRPAYGNILRLIKTDR